MSKEAVTWAMEHAPMLLTAKGKKDATARQVLVALAYRADRNGENSYPSIADIEYRTGWERSTIQRALRRLEEAKLITSVGVTKRGCTIWRLSMEMRRPESDWEEIVAAETKVRDGAAERQRRSRANRVTHSESVTDEPVTPAEPVTEPAHGEQTTIDGTAPKPPAKPRRRTKKERTPEQQAAFDLADQLAHRWWDEVCPQRGIPVIGKRRFTGFRKQLEETLLAGCTENEIKKALLDLNTAWPSMTSMTNTITAYRGQSTPKTNNNQRQAYKNPDNQDIYDG